MASSDNVNRHQAARIVLACSLLAAMLLGCSSQDDPLTGTSWRLDSYGTISTPTDVMVGSPITLTFEPGGVLTGYSGCNTVEGEYETDGDAIAINYYTGPGLHCDGSAIVEQERMFLSILADAQSFTVTSDTLTLVSGERILTFTKV